MGPSCSAAHRRQPNAGGLERRQRHRDHPHPAVLDVQDADPKAALAAVVDGYADAEVTLNSVATEQFRAQLTNYLIGANPPEVLTWYAGSVARSYANEGLLLDVSSVWEGDGACAGFSAAPHSLSSGDDGSQIFVPHQLLLVVGLLQEVGVRGVGCRAADDVGRVPRAVRTLYGQGIAPLTNGIGSTPWMASGWFDYLDLRVNGAEFHRDLLAGEHAFDRPEVREGDGHLRDARPLLRPERPSYSAQEGATPLAQNKAGMYLSAPSSPRLPGRAVDDLDFFSVPTIDPAVPSAEEAPTDGYFASAKSKNADGREGPPHLPGGPAQQQAYIEASGSSNLPTSPDVDTSKFSPLVQKGIELLQETKEITQFFNRDSCDALQATADTALTKFLDDPSDAPRSSRTGRRPRSRSGPDRDESEPPEAAARSDDRSARATRPAAPPVGDAGHPRVPLVVWVVLLVPLLVELAWVFWPAFNSFQLSFTKWSGVGVAEPIGLKNYQTCCPTRSSTRRSATT